MVWIDSLAMFPSPLPTIISPLGSMPKVPTPIEKSFLIGPSLLKIALSMLISNTSPVLVPT